jgi:aminopeptidase N
MKKILLILFVLSIWNFSFGQDLNFRTGAERCAYTKTHSRNGFILNQFDSPNSPRHSFNVLKYTLNMNIYNCFKSPYPYTFSASNKMQFRVDSTLTSIYLNAINTSMTIDSIRLVGGPILAYTHSSDILSITMNRTYSVGEIAEVIIYYRHNSVSDGAFNVNNGYVFTDAEPEGARKWFPCWDRPSDKALLDLTAKVPSNVKLGSNGRLADSTASADTIWYHWVSRDSVSTYLIVMTGNTTFNIAIVKWPRISNPLDTVPIRLYYNSGNSYTWTLNNIGPMTTYYSQKFGEHPFEKNGFATGGSQFVWGGMENQTLTTLCSYCWDEGTVSHEYAHQWFGDMITCGTWADIFINEGFATFVEAVWLERAGGYSAYKSNINSDASTYLSGNPGWAISVPSWAINTPDVNTLFNYEITYCKGACVLHQLRYVLGDTVFFNAIKTYATDTANFKYRAATIPDFFTKIGAVAGQDLSWFMNAWIYQPNHPAYQNGYNFTNLGGGQWRINFLAKQTQTGFFPMPVEIKFSFATGSDTTVRVMNNVNNQLFSFNFNRQPTAVVFDPSNMIVLKTATLSVGVNENEGKVPEQYKLYQNEPNPFNPVTSINYDILKNTHVKMVVYDLLGKEVKTLVNENQNAGKYTISFNGMNLPSGVYLYRLETDNFTSVKKMLMVK